MTLHPVGAAATAEILQGFDVPLLGRTYDPVNFGAYALGAGLGLVFDRALLERLETKGRVPPPEG